MAAYCTCCGAEITLKAERCAVCGTPTHGMIPSEKAGLSCPAEETPGSGAAETGKISKRL